MEATEYVRRPPAPIKAYEFTIQNAEEFVKMLWEWNYLTRLSGNTLTFTTMTTDPAGFDITHRMYDGDYLIEHTDASGWRIEVMTQGDFEDRYTVYIPSEVPK